MPLKDPRTDLAERLPNAAGPVAMPPARQGRGAAGAFDTLRTQIHP